MSASEGGPALAAAVNDAPGLPLIFEGHEVAELLGWERRRALRFLRDLGILKRGKRRWGVSRADLERELPEVLDEARQRLEAGLPLVLGARRRGQRRPS